MKRYGTILLYLIAAEILTLFINVTLSVFGGTAFRVITSVCTVGILVVLMIQAGSRLGKEDKKRRNAGEKTPHIAGAGILASLPMGICWLLLLHEKCSVMTAGFYRFYKLLCAPFLQICNLLSADVTADTLPWMGVVLLGVLSLLPAAAVCISYVMVMRDVQIEEIMYKKPE
ncbi:MAG: hypothetical protein IJN11_02420 [Oscillospiraceae bacterium]|nr:hypothetical protein [Oscillospiraceae bacterium]